MAGKRTPKALGPTHHAWVGPAVSEKGGRTRALRMYPGQHRCELCQAANAERHHKNGNTANNEPSNIWFLCRRCHMVEDGRLDALRVLAKSNLPIMADARWKDRIDTSARPGDQCPECGNRMQIVSVRRRNSVAFRYVGCRRARGGCGYNAGSFTERFGD